MLDGLFAALPYVKNKDSVLESISLGASFYKNKMFRQNGSSYFRYPKPVRHENYEIELLKSYPLHLG